VNGRYYLRPRNSIERILRASKVRGPAQHRRETGTPGKGKTLWRRKTGGGGAKMAGVGATFVARGSVSHIVCVWIRSIFRKTGCVNAVDRNTQASYKRKKDDQCPRTCLPQGSAAPSDESWMCNSHENRTGVGKELLQKPRERPMERAINSKKGQTERAVGKKLWRKTKFTYH